MKNTLLALNLLVLTATASADWSGVWSGEGQAVLQPGSANESTLSCSLIGIKFTESSQTLNLQSGGYRCGDIKANYGTALFTIQGDQLVINGKNYGDISATKLDLVETDTDGTLFHLTLQRQADGSVSYFEQWSDGDTIDMTVKGNLHHQ